METPTLERIKECQELSLDLGDFLEWLKEHYIILDKSRPRSEDERAVVDAIGCGDYIDTQKTLADYFHIDLEEAEREKAAILELLRENPSNNVTHGEDRKDDII